MVANQVSLAYTSFEEWNPNPEVATAAEKLYGHIDNLELYVGLQAEDTKPVIEGAGLCPGYTVSRAILSDAIALTRGDRFYTEDFTPYNMTSWGFADCQRDPNGWGFGSTLGRLFLRTLPNNYDERSVYTWFPLMHPEAMEKALKDLGKQDDYSLERPKNRSPPTTVSGYVEVGEVFRDAQNFTAVAEQRASEVFKGKGFVIYTLSHFRSPILTPLIDSSPPRSSQAHWLRHPRLLTRSGNISTRKLPNWSRLPPAR